MKAGIVLDSWKFKFFKKILDREGFVYEETRPTKGPLRGCIILQVEITDAAKLVPFVSEAQTAAANSKLD